MLNSISAENLFVPFSREHPNLGNRPVTERRLSDLRGCFADASAYENALKAGDPLIYSVTPVEPAQGEGQLHYGLGVLYPGRVGGEYYLTKGHYHAVRPAAEVYVGVAGDGLMLLEDEHEERLVPLRANSVVYVPGNTAHRTVNVGSDPLVYLGIYPSNAGHDYASLSARNFRNIVVCQDGKPTLIKRRHLP